MQFLQYDYHGVKQDREKSRQDDRDANRARVVAEHRQQARHQYQKQNRDSAKQSIGRRGRRRKCHFHNAPLTFVGSGLIRNLIGHTFSSRCRRLESRFRRLTGLRGGFLLGKWSVRETGAGRPAPIELRAPQLTSAGFCGTERRTATHQLSRTHEDSPDRARLIYFSNTLSICPIFFSTLPVFFSALPSACRLGLSVTLPAISLTLPFTS